MGEISFFFGGGVVVKLFMANVKWLWKEDSLKNIPKIQPKSHLPPTSPDTAISRSSARGTGHPWQSSKLP